LCLCQLILHDPRTPKLAKILLGIAKDSYSGFGLAVKRAGIQDCTIHTVRHTGGSHLVMNGVDLATVKELLGHRDIQTTLRYAHLAQEHQREAIAKMGKLATLDT
jgi:integrase